MTPKSTNREWEMGTRAMNIITTLCTASPSVRAACILVAWIAAVSVAVASDPPGKRKSPFSDYNLSRPAALEDVTTKSGGGSLTGSNSKDDWRDGVVERINEAIRQQVKVDGGKLKYEESVQVDLDGYYSKEQILQLQKELKSAGWQVWRVKGSNLKGGINTIYLITVEKD